MLFAAERVWNLDVYDGALLLSGGITMSDGFEFVLGLLDLSGDLNFYKTGDDLNVSWIDYGLSLDSSNFYFEDDSDLKSVNLSTGDAVTIGELQKGSDGFILTDYKGKLLGFSGRTLTNLTIFDSHGDIDRSLNIQTVGRIAR